MNVIIFGEPVGKGRPKFTTIGGFGRAYTPAKTATWERRAASTMRAAWGGAPALDEPTEVVVLAFCKRPQRLCRKKDPDGPLWRMSLPDSDNVAKAVLDALQKAGVVSDDKVVVDLRVLSLYADKGEEGRVVVLVRKIHHVLDAQALPKYEVAGGAL